MALDERVTNQEAKIVDGSDPYIGKLLAGRYKIERLLGSGGWGNVYLAEHLALSNKVAIKILHHHLANDDYRQKRLEQEAQVLSKLDSHYIIKTIDYGLTPSPFIVMEYFVGASLDQIIKAEPISEKVAIDIFEQLGYGLQAAHAAGLIHRDLKPSNVLIATQSGSYRAKLLDFGIAKISQANSDGNKLTATGEILGSPPYMSPEQWTARPTDQRSDIYSLGCLMYEVISGHAIFEGASSFEYLNLHLSEEPKTFAEIAPERKVSAGLESIVRTCLQKAPEDRYQSSEELLEDLNSLKAGKQLKAKTRRKRAVQTKTKEKALKTAILFAFIIPIAVSSTIFVCRTPIAESACTHLNEQGNHYRRTNRPTEAIASFRQSLAFSQLLPKQNPLRLTAMNQLVELLSKKGQFSEAQKLKNDHKKEIGDIQPEQWNTNAEHQEKLLHRHKFAEAEKLARENLALAEQIAGKHSVLYARSLDNLGLVYRENGRAKEAVAIQEEALSLTSALLDADSIVTSQYLNHLGLCYRAAGRPQEAQQSYEKAIEISNRHSTPEIELSNQYYNLAGLFLEQKEYAKALRAGQRADELNSQLGGNAGTAIKARMGMIYQRMRRYDDAIKVLMESLALREKRKTLNSTMANHDYYNLGLCYERKGEMKEAAQYYQKCMDTYKASGTEPDSYYPMFKQSYDRVSALLPAKGQRADAHGK